MPTPYAFYQLIQQFLQLIQIWYSQTTYLIFVLKVAFPVQQVKIHSLLEFGVDPWCTYEDWSNVTNLFVSKPFL
ncbi:hypothetical protein H5410_049842, partial [Solanum commersonii]